MNRLPWPGMWWAGLGAGILSACGLGVSQRLAMDDAPVGLWPLEPKDAVQRNRAKAQLADLQHNWGLWLCQQGQSTLAIPQFQRAMNQPGYALRNKTELAMTRCVSLAKG